MTNEITALENISNDFGWLYPLVDKLLSNSIFVFFLGISATVLIWGYQTKQSHHLELVAEKRKLFRGFLRQVGRAQLIDRTENWGYDPDILKMRDISEEISLIAEKEVNELVLAVEKAVFHILSTKNEPVSCSDGEARMNTSYVSYEQKRLTKAMREELKK